MKNLMVIAALTICCCILQPQGLQAQASPNTSNNGNGRKEYVIMQNGKVMLVKNGQTVAITVETTLRDGKKVEPDGSVINKDGKKWTLKEGQSIDMHGAIKK